jgi:hypothetical protein
MAIDFDAIRKKLSQLSGNGSRRDKMWRPEEGETSSIRIISFPDNDGQPFKERWFYYNIGDNPGFLTPHQFGDPDPIQELINKLRADNKKESYELAKKLYPKMRSYAAVIVRGEEDKGVRLWSFGKMVYQDLLKTMIDEDYGDITDPLEGRDIRVECSKQPGKKWAMTTVRPRPKSSPLSTDSKQAKMWMDNIPNLDDLYSCKSYDELERIINNWLNDPMDEDGNSYDSGEKNSSVPPSKKFNDLNDAFKDLANF